MADTFARLAAEHAGCSHWRCIQCGPTPEERIAGRRRARRVLRIELAAEVAEALADLDGPPCCPIVGGVRVCDCSEEQDYGDEPDPLALLEAEVRAYERGLDALRLGRL